MEYTTEQIIKIAYRVSRNEFYVFDTIRTKKETKRVNKMLSEKSKENYYLYNLINCLNFFDSFIFGKNKNIPIAVTINYKKYGTRDMKNMLVAFTYPNPTKKSEKFFDKKYLINYELIKDQIEIKKESDGLVEKILIRNKKKYLKTIRLEEYLNIKIITTVLHEIRHRFQYENNTTFFPPQLSFYINDKKYKNFLDIFLLLVEVLKPLDLNKYKKYFDSKKEVDAFFVQHTIYNHLLLYGKISFEKIKQLITLQ